MQTLLFAENMQFLRTEFLQVKISEIPSLLDIPRTTWSNYEHGTSTPSLKDLMKISDEFGISEYDLLRTELSVDRPKITFEGKFKLKNSLVTSSNDVEIASKENNISDFVISNRLKTADFGTQVPTNVSKLASNPTISGTFFTEKTPSVTPSVNKKTEKETIASALKYGEGLVANLRSKIVTQAQIIEAQAVSIAALQSALAHAEALLKKQ